METKVPHRARSGRRLPTKTTKHLILINGVFKHISMMEEVINIPLERLECMHDLFHCFARARGRKIKKMAKSSDQPRLVFTAIPN